MQQGHLPEVGAGVHFVDHHSPVEDAHLARLEDVEHVPLLTLPDDVLAFGELRDVILLKCKTEFDNQIGINEIVGLDAFGDSQ